MLIVFGGGPRQTQVTARICPGATTVFALGNASPTDGVVQATSTMGRQRFPGDPSPRVARSARHQATRFCGQ